MTSEKIEPEPFDAEGVLDAVNTCFDDAFAFIEMLAEVGTEGDRAKARDLLQDAYLRMIHMGKVLGA